MKSPATTVLMDLVLALIVFVVAEIVGAESESNNDLAKGFDS